jgi:HEAT repeat protein
MVLRAEGRPEVFAEWVERLASHEAAESVPALWALQQAEAPVIPTLLAGLAHPNARIRRNCTDIIDHGGVAADARCVAALVTALHDTVPRVRRQVAYNVGLLG